MSLNLTALKEDYSLELHNQGFVPFDLYPGEQVKFASRTPRQSLVLKLKVSDPAAKPAINISAKDGRIYLTTRRMVYVTSSQGDINDFSVTFSDIPKLQFSHALKSPWFGPNYWLFLFHASLAAAGAEWVEGSIKFLDGGLFEFVPLFDTFVNNVVVNPEIDDELPRYSEV